MSGFGIRLLRVYADVLERYHFRYGPKKAYLEGVYDNDEEYFADLAKAYQVELKILYDAGLRNVKYHKRLSLSSY